MRYWYVCAIFLAGLLFICLTPPFQNPDEGVHLFRAIQLASGEMKGGVENGILGCSVPRSVTVDYHQYSAMVKRVHVGTTLAEWNSIRQGAADWTPDRWVDRVHVPCQFQQYPPVAHLPQAAAALSGRLLRLNTIEVVYLGRTLCLVSGCALLFMAFTLLKDDPRAQFLAFLVAGLPTSVAMFSSLSADTLTISFAILLLASAISLNQQWSTRRFWCVAACAALLALCKNVYFPIVLVAVPAIWRHHSQWKPRMKWSTILMAAAVVPLVLWFVYLGDLATVSVKPKLVLTPQDKLQEIINGPLQFLWGWFSYLFNDRAYLESAFVGAFGWSEAGVPRYLAHAYCLVLLAAAVIGVAGGGKWNKWDAATRITVFVGISFGIYLALFLMTGRVRVTRTQARYYIPIAMVLLTAVPVAWRLVPRHFAIWRSVVLVGWAGAVAISCNVLYERFWADDLASMRLGRMEQHAKPPTTTSWVRGADGQWELLTQTGATMQIKPLNGTHVTLEYAVPRECWEIGGGVRVDLATQTGRNFWNDVLRPAQEPEDRQVQIATVQLPPDIGSDMKVKVRFVGPKGASAKPALQWRRVDFASEPEELAGDIQDSAEPGLRADGGHPATKDQ